MRVALLHLHYTPPTPPNWDLCLLGLDSPCLIPNWTAQTQLESTLISSRDNTSSKLDSPCLIQTRQPPNWTACFSNGSVSTRLMHKLNMFCYIRKTGLSRPPCSERNIPYQWDLTGISSASPLSRCVTTPAHRQARRAGLHESIQRDSSERPRKLQACLEDEA